MKKLITVCLFTLLISNTYAQVKINPKDDPNITDTELSKYYKSKSKQQNIGGWILLTGGVAIGALSMVKAESYEGLIVGEIVGALSAAGGIGLFFAASRNKGRAEVLVRNNPVPMSFEAVRNIPVKSVGISFRIGHK